MTKLLTFKDFDDYQVRVIKESMELKNAAWFIGTGLGKTIMALTVIDQLQKRKLIESALVIAPKKVIFNTWRQEAQKWEHTKRLKFSIIHHEAGRGNSERIRRVALARDADVYLINYENLAWLRKELDHIYHGDKIPFKAIFYDESTKIKHSTTQRFLRFKPYMKRFKYRYILTGTPIPNGLHDIFGQMYAVDAGIRLGTTVTSFRKRFFNSYSPEGTYRIYTPLPDAKKRIQNRIKDVTMYLKKTDYVKLPPIKYNPIEMDLPDKYMADYRELEEKFFLELKDAKIEAFASSALSMKLRQYLQGSVYTYKGENRYVEWIHNEKLNMLKEMIDKKTGKVEGIGNCLIAYNFHFEQGDLWSILPDAPAIDGRTSEREAMQHVNAWNSGKLPVLLVNPASVAHGLNLQTGGNQVLWYSLTWNLEHYIQLIDRLWRRGQEKPVFVHHLLFRKTLDMAIFQALCQKDATQESLLNALKDYRR